MNAKFLENSAALRKQYCTQNTPLFGAVLIYTHAHKPRLRPLLVLCIVGTSFLWCLGPMIKAIGKLQFLAPSTKTNFRVYFLNPIVNQQHLQRRSALSLQLEGPLLRHQVSWLSLRAAKLRCFTLWVQLSPTILLSYPRRQVLYHNQWVALRSYPITWAAERQGSPRVRILVGPKVPQERRQKSIVTVRQPSEASCLLQYPDTLSYIYG